MSFRFRYLSVAAFTLFALPACSGGGGGGSALPPAVHGTSPTTAPTTAPTVAPTATPPTTSAVGRVVDLTYDGTSANPGYSVTSSGAAAAPGAGIANAVVFLGSSVVEGTTAPSTTPSGFARAVTASDGSFTIAGVAPGKYAITIFAPAPHVAVVHQDYTAAAGSASKTFYMTAPSVTEAAWYAQQSADRALYGASPLVIDESALEASRYWSQFMATNDYFSHCVPASLCEAGDTTPAPASYGPQDVDPQHRFAYFHGFSGVSEGENIAAGFATWTLADAGFMAEAALCPGGQPANCSFNSSTGHFLNIVNASYQWTGLGMANSSTLVPYYTEDFSLVYSATPASAVRSTGNDVPGLRAKRT